MKSYRQKVRRVAAYGLEMLCHKGHILPTARLRQTCRHADRLQKDDPSALTCIALCRPASCKPLNDDPQTEDRSYLYFLVSKVIMTHASMELVCSLVTTNKEPQIDHRRRGL